MFSNIAPIRGQDWFLITRGYEASLRVAQELSLGLDEDDNLSLNPTTHALHLRIEANGELSLRCAAHYVMVNEAGERKHTQRIEPQSPVFLWFRDTRILLNTELIYTNQNEPKILRVVPALRVASVDDEASSVVAHQQTSPIVVIDQEDVSGQKDDIDQEEVIVQEEAIVQEDATDQEDESDQADATTEQAANELEPIVVAEQLPESESDQVQAASSPALFELEIQDVLERLTISKEIELSRAKNDFLFNKPTALATGAIFLFVALLQFTNDAGDDTDAAATQPAQILAEPNAVATPENTSPVPEDNQTAINVAGNRTDSTRTPDSAYIDAGTRDFLNLDFIGNVAWPAAIQGDKLGDQTRQTTQAIATSEPAARVANPDRDAGNK